MRAWSGNPGGKPSLRKGVSQALYQKGDILICTPTFPNPYPCPGTMRWSVALLTGRKPAWNGGPPSSVSANGEAKKYCTCGPPPDLPLIGGGQPWAMRARSLDVLCNALNAGGPETNMTVGLCAALARRQASPRATPNQDPRPGSGLARQANLVNDMWLGQARAVRRVSAGAPR